MKCPKCRYNQRARCGMKCDRCGYEFVFNPKDPATRGLTDGKFEACIRAASQNGTTYFTRNQLYAVFCRRMRGSPAGAAIGAVVALAAAAVFAAMELWPFGFMAGILGVGLLFSAMESAMRKYTPQQFDRLLDTWLSSGRTIDRLIEKPSLHDPPPEWSEPDIYDYGVERLLIVERDILVDLFVKNGVHAEQRMLVLSESGYPEYLLPVARRLLEEQPDLVVFLLHDATEHGVMMQERVLASGLLPLSQHPIVDLGLFPSDFRKLKRTNQFDPDNKKRALPVDAMMLPFMTLGLAAAMAEGTTLGTLIEQQQERVADASTISFG